MPSFGPSTNAIPVAPTGILDKRTFAEAEHVMNRRNLTTAAVALAIALIQTSAGAQGHPTLHVNPRWKECSIQLSSSLTQEAWRQFTQGTNGAGAEGRKSPDGAGAEGRKSPDGAGAEGRKSPNGAGAEGRKSPNGAGAEGRESPNGAGAEGRESPNGAKF